MMVGLARTNRGKEAVSVRHLFDKIALMHRSLFRGFIPYGSDLKSMRQ